MSAQSHGCIDHSTHPLDSVALLLGHANSLSPRRQRHVIVGIFTEKLKELLWIRGNQLRQLRVARTELLENGLEHLRLLLDDLTQLLELRVVSEELQVSEIAAASTDGSGSSSRGRRSSSSGTATATATASATTSLLCCEIEEIDAAVVASSSCGCFSRLGCGSLGSSGGLALLLLLLHRFGDALHS